MTKSLLQLVVRSFFHIFKEIQTSVSQHDYSLKACYREPKIRYGLDWFRGNYIPAEGLSDIWQTAADSSQFLVFSRTIPPLHFLILALVLLPNRTVVVGHGYFITHLLESQLGVGSGDERSGFEAQFAICCVFNLWTRSPALNFLDHKMGRQPKSS